MMLSYLNFTYNLITQFLVGGAGDGVEHIIFLPGIGVA
jgi:hypothetical protein